LINFDKDIIKAYCRIEKKKSKYILLVAVIALFYSRAICGLCASAQSYSGQWQKNPSPCNNAIPYHNTGKMRVV
jgi:hypothetical protein